MNAELASAVERLGYLRLPGGGRLHREWLHFVVHADGLDVVLNFSVLQSRDVSSPRGNVLLLVRDRDGSWEGDVDEVTGERVRAARGRLRLDLGDASLRFDGAFRVRAVCRRRPVSVDLVLEPSAYPYLVHNSGQVQWLVAPRWRASGVVTRNGMRHVLDAAPAYHDHNWGDFEGADLAWRWACSLSPDGWSAVFVQLLDRACNRTLSQGLLLWDGARRDRSFRGAEVSCTSVGLLRAGTGLRVPRALSLLAPATASDVPQRLRLSAIDGEDRIEGELACADMARVLVPRDMDLGLTIIHEVKGRLRLEGNVGGREMRIDAPAFAELLGWMP